MLHNGELETPECQRKFGRLRIQSVRCSAGDIEDISKSGMRVRTKRRLKPNDKPLRIRINLGDSKVKIWGHVTWARQNIRGQWYAGIAFIGLTEEQGAELTRLARTAASNTQMVSKIA